MVGKMRRSRNTGNTAGSTAGPGYRSIPGAGLILTVLSALVLPLWLLALAGWAVQLAGVAAVQYDQGRHFLQVRRRQKHVSFLLGFLFLWLCAEY